MLTSDSRRLERAEMRVELEAPASSSTLMPPQRAASRPLEEWPYTRPLGLLRVVSVDLSHPYSSSFGIACRRSAGARDRAAKRRFLPCLLALYMASSAASSRTSGSGELSG